VDDTLHDSLDNVPDVIRCDSYGLG